MKSKDISLSDLSLPLDIQVAIKIVNKYSIWLVTNTETGKLIPHYYRENRFVEDQFCNAICGFIKKELLEIFTFLLNPDYFYDKPERCNELRDYDVSESDLQKYQNYSGYLNSLTKNITKNIIHFHHLVKEESEFDSEPTLINAQNGILDLVSGQLLEHMPDKLIRNIINANFNFPCRDKIGNEIANETMNRTSLFYQVISGALYDKSKNEIENKEIVRSFMEILASFLIGNNEHKLVYIIIGEPNTGKSTLLEVLLGIFGGYGTTFNNSALLYSSRTSNDIRPDIIALKGKRFLAGSEANKFEKFDNALLKQISGNDKISVRKPHKGNMVTFTVSGKILLVANFCPMFSDLEDQAFLNRIVLIDFNNVPQKFDMNLKEKLLTQESRDEIFSYLANIACEIVSKKEIFIHERFFTNKQKILINQNSTVSLFWKEHIRPHDDYKAPTKFMYHHPINFLYKAMYIDFCKNHKFKLEPLPYEAFAKEFKLISDQFPASTWKHGESNNYYIGFDVVGEKANFYYKMLNQALIDKNYVSREGLFD